MKREPEIRVLFLVHTNKKNVTVHSVHSNLVKIHSKSPMVMGFCPVCLGILPLFMAKHLAEYYL